MKGKTAPAGTNFNQMVGGFELQLAANQIKLGYGGFPKARLRRSEDGGGIHQGVVKKQAEKIIAEVIMGGNVAAAAAFRIPVHGMDQFSQRRCNQRIAAIHAIQHMAVAQQDTVVL